MIRIDSAQVERTAHYRRQGTCVLRRQYRQCLRVYISADCARSQVMSDALYDHLDAIEAAGAYRGIDLEKELS